VADETGTANDGKLHVLAVVEDAETTRQCLTAAMQAAAIDPRAVLTALHIEVDPDRIRAAPEEVSLQHLREPQEGSSHDRAIQIQRIYEFWAAANRSSTATWRKSVGTVDATLTKEAAHADLIVLCQAHNLDGADALHAAIFHGRKLVLFVPRGPLRQLSLDHLAVAWKNTPQASKAVQQARPWLVAAKQVSVLSVEEHPHTHNADRLEQLMGRLAIPFEHHHLKPEHGNHISTTLLEAAARLQAGAVVMGAYRFGEALEWIFGGVTSEVLRQSPLPVFLAH
jgi:nucleotide-binding universal stress UspA family protein